MARLGPGTWYDPKEGISAARIAAREVFLKELNELARPAVESLMDQVIPAYRARFNDAARRRAAIVICPGPRAWDYRLDPAAPLWDWGGDELWGEEVKILMPGWGPEVAAKSKLLMEHVLEWCRTWSLPPRPEVLLEPSGPRRAEIWLLNALGYSLSKWIGAQDPDIGQLRLIPYPHGSPHLILPKPPIGEFRPWWPTLEPWDIEDRVTWVRVGYFHEARRALGLSHRKARAVLEPYKTECEERLLRAGHQRTPQKRGEQRRKHTSATLFRWFVRFQVLRETQAMVSPASDPDSIRIVRAALKGVSELLPLLRRQREASGQRK